nr:hypothetical protein BACY1_15410 [Tenacibaculum mesophilum]
MLLKLKLFTFILFVFYVQNMFGLNEGITYNLKLPSNCKGLIIVFPKLGASSENTDKETQIDDKAFLRGYGTIIFDYNRSFYLTLEDFNKVYRIVKKVVRGNNIPEDEIVIGGFSIGGNIALSYCIWVNKLQKK